MKHPCDSLVILDVLIKPLELTSLENTEEHQEEENEEEGVNLSLDRVSDLKAEAFNVGVNIILVIGQL